MNSTALNIIASIFVVSCVISMLFVLVRTYFCYFAKPKKCSRDCSCEALKDARLVEMYCDKEEVEASVKTPAYTEKTKRTRKPKAEATTEKPAKKKPGRKKKI